MLADPRSVSSSTARWVLGAALAVAWLTSVPARAIVGPSDDGAALAATILMVLNHTGRVAGYCSGIVVTQDAVLTAAHCTPPGAEIKVHFRKQGTPVLLDVAAIERSPDFRANAIKTREQSIDLALIRLARPLPPTFRPATLGDDHATAVGTDFRLAGYGLREENEARSSGTLRVATVAAQNPLSSVLLWASDPAKRGSGACTGDSGGPVLTQDDAVVGVIAWSAGAGGSHCGILTQAIWIGPQRGWIDGVLQRWHTAR